VRLAHPREPGRGAVERLVPRDLFPTVVLAPQGDTDPVRVFVQTLETDRLRAEVAPAERIVLVPLDREDRPPLAVDFDGDAAMRLGAGAISNGTMDAAAPSSMTTKMIRGNCAT
jgi:hypothetical protein